MAVSRVVVSWSAAIVRHPGAAHKQKDAAGKEWPACLPEGTLTLWKSNDEVAMLTILGKSYAHCDGLGRREFLAAGALGGLTLAGLLRAEEAAGIKSSTKAVIIIYLDGGPPQMDTIDLKPNAPVEVRGEFRPIATKLP